MHCDDKRTIFALKKNIDDSIEEKEKLSRKLITETNHSEKIKIQNEIRSLEKFINEIKFQLGRMENSS